MTDKTRPRVIILESNDAVRTHAESILTREGWDVTCEQVSKEALNTLEHAKNPLFALFISNFKLPKMEGDDILQNVKSISPLTQRMLLVPADKADTVISAVNKAEINACIISPFNDDDLVYQAKNCFKQFVYTLKREQLKRVIVHQNKQMFKIAQKLKKKDDTYKQLIDGKKSQKLMLKSKKRNLENQNHLKSDITLSSLLEQEETPLSPDQVKHAFLTLCKDIQAVFDQVTTRHHSQSVTLHLEKMVNPEEQAPEQGLPGNDPATTELIKKVLNQAFIRMMHTGIHHLPKPPEADHTDETETFLAAHFDISINENQTKASIKKIREFERTLPPTFFSDLLDMLRQKQISHGIIDHEAIHTWISKSCVNTLVIATGEDPVYGRDGEIKYQFITDFTNPGKISDDGSIDFRERGDIPFVGKGTLLAQKTLPKEGKPGITVSGISIPVDEAVDPVFIAGSGTEPSEDGRCIHAAIDGQPHLDALGTISVSPELLIPGDVDFETGNIDFKGNIIVKGMIKEGFTVKGVNLTAQEVEGADIHLSGDLNISAGITNSTLTTHGNIYAKFINHSTIMGFGNVIISKEIIDSNILISGSCQNPGGHIISSTISARLGIEAGKIGTSSSIPTKLKVGADEHVETLITQIDALLEASAGTVNRLKDDMKKLEDQDQELYRQISEKAHTQDRAQLEIKEFKKSLPELEKSNDTARLQHASNGIKKLMERAKQAEQELNTIFETQDTLANKIEHIKHEISLLEEKNKTHVIEKKALKEFSKKNTPLAAVTVAKTITQDSIVKGPHTALVLREDRSRCRIQEITVDKSGIPFDEMVISDL